MLNATYSKLTNKTVRDLYWLLFSPSPLSPNFDIHPYRLLPNNIIDEWKLASINYFLHLDMHPQEIEHFIGKFEGNRRKNKRLGFYAESLLSFFFQTFSHIELLLQNFQIIEEKRTIGEIDFIIRYKKEVIHIECAVKYYLLKDIKLKEDNSQWVGPRLRDNLELKIKKIVEHQLPLGRRTEVQEKINATIDESYLLLNGIFFTEREINLGKINNIQPNQFIRVSKVETLDAKPIQVLSRPNWLSSTSGIIEKHSQMTFDLLKFKEELENPEMVLFSDGQARFVVSDNWGERTI